MEGTPLPMCLLTMTLHILLMPRPGHQPNKNDGTPIDYLVFDESKVKDPVHPNKLDPKNPDSYYAKATKRIQSIYEEDPTIFHDLQVALYASGLTSALFGTVNACVKLGLNLSVGIWDRETEQYNFQPWEHKNSKLFVEKIVPLSALNKIIYK